MGTKHFDTSGRSMWTARRTMLTNRAHCSNSMRVSWSFSELFSHPRINHIGHIPWEYLGQSMNFSDDPRMLKASKISCASLMLKMILITFHLLLKEFSIFSPEFEAQNSNPKTKLGLPYWLELYNNTAIAPLQRSNPPTPTTTSSLSIILNCTWWWGFASGALENVVYPFNAIIPNCTLTRIGSTYYGHIYGSNRIVQSFNKDYYYYYYYCSSSSCRNSYSSSLLKPYRCVQIIYIT